ncbi:hypothetical protein AaE_008067 [Aphanomyces astaci]|uniref:Peptidase M20 dimerisation domain-containing protein n=1 Tax=Aphanomyces astaci TaxID=112090 RepID=A0A6A5AEE6_APHAT|nr:hypothetical protein AaE_008067 [Aphanomyces astaci]
MRLISRPSTSTTAPPLVCFHIYILPLHIPPEYAGLVVDIVGPTEGDKTSPVTCIAFRGDMDALPMTEANPHLSYASQAPQVAHMCGHDGHTVTLMGFAYLVEPAPPLIAPPLGRAVVVSAS